MKKQNITMKERGQDEKTTLPKKQSTKTILLADCLIGIAMEKKA
ncbi:MAG: hypothetical protein ACLVG7_08615 [Negativibacillus sp.]